MDIGLFTSAYQFTELEKAFADAKAFGYDFLELWGGYPHAYPVDMDEKRIDGIRNLIRKYELPIRVYTPEMNAYAYNLALADHSQRERIEQYLFKSIDIAEKLAIPYVLISLGKGQKEISYKEDYLFHSLQKIVQYAEKKKCIILLETLTPMESNVCCNIQELAYFIEKIDSPYLMAICDLVAAYASKETVNDYHQRFAEKLGHVHFIDGDGTSEDHLIPGEGVYPLSDIYRFLKHSDYRQGITIELVNKYCDNPSLSFKKAMKKIKEYQNV